MTTATHTARVDEWEEVPAAPIPPATIRTIGRMAAADVGEPVDDSPWLCRCWRCRGGRISPVEAGYLDRMLARELMRMAPGERGLFLLAYQGKHGDAATNKLHRWLDIERGQDLPPPVYLPTVAASLLRESTSPRILGWLAGAGVGVSSV